MKKLVTALIIVLPIVLVVALFAITGIVRISADIPVNGITITNKGNDGVYFFDIADYNHPLYESDLGIQVLPNLASNKDYSLSITDAGGNATDVVSRDSDGAFRLHGIGLAKLTYTSNDGGYSDSVLFNVTTTGALDFIPVLKDNGGNPYTLDEGESTDYSVTLPTGKYVLSGVYSPSAVQSADFTISADNDEIITLTDNNGGFNAVFSGKTVLTMTVVGANGNLEKTIELNIVRSSSVTINGMDANNNDVRLSAPLNVTSLSFGVQFDIPLSVDDVSVSGVGATCTVGEAQTADNAFIVTLKLDEPYTSATSMRYTLRAGGRTYRLYVDFDSHKILVYSPTNSNGEGDIVLLSGTTTVISVSCLPNGLDIGYEFEIEEQDAVHIMGINGDKCTLTTASAGETVIRINWNQYDENGNIIATGTESRRIIAVQGYSSLLFAEHSESFGLGGTLAIATDKMDDGGNTVRSSYLSKFRAYDRAGKVAPVSDIVFSSSDNAIATVERDGNDVYIKAHSTGAVTITAVWKYADAFGVKPAEITLYAVDGVEVNSDESIRAAFANNRQVVLKADIYLGENLFVKNSANGRVPKYDAATMREKLLQYTREIKTTADSQYYKNIGQGQPSVRYCLEITSNVFGNGHTLNAQYITDMLDSTDTPYDFAVFKGPLDFVATNSNGIKLASVKAQDNIVFLIRKDGITVDNAVLKGCDDETIYDNGKLNLSLLNNIGTTVEIMSNAVLKNCRVMNGRTVVRAFGRDGVDGNSSVNAQAERITAAIDGCILQNAREFLLKIGTNRVLRGTAENPSPYFADGKGNEYSLNNSPDCDNYINDDYFMSNLMLTDVTVKNSILRTSGLFTIGVESHFCGPMLAGSKNAIFQLEGWHDLAGTSYPAILRLVGDVELADWKNIASVDSSTLIECNSTQDSLAFLSLNIAEMLKTVQQFGGEKYKDLIADKNGEKYVHGGIAFYGGGRNYSILDTSEYTFEKMNHYNVNLSILTKSPDEIISSQGWMLPAAAGEWDFRFVMFDATSEYGHSAQQDAK